MQDQRNGADYERYDRQIRIWGEVSQRELSKTIVYIDHLSDFSSEMIKNLALAGVRKIAIGIVPGENHILQPININNVFHILEGKDQIERIQRLNPHVLITVGSSLDDFEDFYSFSDHIIFVYHTLSEAQRHQKQFNQLSQCNERVLCLCITACGDIGRVICFDPYDTRKTSFVDCLNRVHISRNASILENEFCIVWSIANHFVELFLERQKLLLDGETRSEPISFILPPFHVVVEMILNFNQDIFSIADIRVPFLADCILSAVKVNILQKLHEECDTSIRIQFIEYETNERDYCVPLGVELCSIISGIASQQAIKFVTNLEDREIFHSAKSQVDRCIFVDAWDHCKSEVKRSYECV